MKVLLVTHENISEPNGGLSTFIINHKNELLKNNINVKILYLKYSNAKEFIDTNMIEYKVDMRYSYIGTESREAKIIDTVATSQYDIFKVLEEFKPDIIHVNDRQTFLPFKEFRDKVVYSIHMSVQDMKKLKGMDDADWYEYKIEKFALESSRVQIVYSEFMKNRVVDNIANCYPFKLKLGLDLTKFYSKKDPNKIVVSYFGRVQNEQKGIIEFIKAVSFLNTDLFKKYNLEFNLYGKDVDKLKDLDKKRFKKIKHIVNENEKLKAYAESDIIIMPSKYEPFGYVGLEAIASECVLLCPDKMGMDEYINRGNHVSIEPNELDIREKLVSVIENLNLFQKGNNIDSIKNFTTENSVKEHIEIYNSIINGRITNLNIENYYNINNIKEKAKRYLDISDPCCLKFNSKKIEYVNNLIKNKQVLSIGGTEFEKEFYKDKKVTLNNILYETNNDYMENLSYNDKSFDTVIALDVLEHSVNIDIAFKEILRVASKQILLSIPFNIFDIDHKVNFESRSQIRTWLENFIKPNQITLFESFEIDINKEIYFEKKIACNSGVCIIEISLI